VHADRFWAYGLCRAADLCGSLYEYRGIPNGGQWKGGPSAASPVGNILMTWVAIRAAIALTNLEPGNGQQAPFQLILPDGRRWCARH
jgi:hypothetical protein